MGGRYHPDEVEELGGKVPVILAAIDKANLITTQKQLDATPAGTVFIDSYPVHLGGDAYQKSGTGTYWRAGPQGEFRNIKLPAQVLRWVQS